MSHIEPNFEIDKKGRVICKIHSNYEFFDDYHNDRILEKELTCKTCSHYHNDDCFFPRSEIAKIEFDRLKSKNFNCRLCGNKIDRMFTVIHKLFYQVKHNIEFPLICCTCYDTLKDNKFIESSKWRSNLFLYNSLYAVYSLVSVLFFIFIYQIKIYYLAFFLVPIIYLFYHNLMKRKELKKGLEYYKKHFLKT